ncbi:MAG: NusG domain II-containing protein [Mariprofundaceae bacterium]
MCEHLQDLGVSLQPVNSLSKDKAGNNSLERKGCHFSGSWGDRVLLMVILSAIVLLWQQLIEVQSDDPWLFIQRGDQVIASYPLLGHFRTLDFDGVTIEVGQGAAHVVHASCAQQRCVQSGHIHQVGEWIACLPNRLLMHIGNRQQNQQWDAIVE